MIHNPRSENKSNACLDALAFNASGVVLKLLNPLLAASISFTISVSFKRIFLECLMYSLKTECLSSCLSFQSKHPLLFWNLLAAFAIAFNVNWIRTIWEPPSKSNLFPVKANGEFYFYLYCLKERLEFYLHLILNLFFPLE
jgi:hypothetical protein